MSLFTLGLAAMVVLACGCAGTVDQGPPQGRLIRSPSSAQLILDQAPSRVAAGSATETPKRWQTDNRLTNFASITDLAPWSQDTVALTTSDDDVILLVDPTGREVRRIGHPGPGPGELRSPFIVVTGDSTIVALQADPLRTLTALDRTGRVLGIHPMPEGGDWVTMKYRGPSLGVNGPGKRPSGAEDPTRRFAMDDGTLYAIVQHGETDAKGAPTGTAAVAAVVLAMNLRTKSVDTLGKVATPLLKAHSNADRPDVYPLYDVPVYGAFPLLAAGSGWVAWASGGDTSVTVRFRDGRADSLLTVSWPRSGRVLTEDDRIAAVLNDAELTLVFADAKMVAEARSYSRSQLREIGRQFAELWPFADTSPELTAMFGAGRCLFLAGFGRDDYYDGTSRTLTVVDVNRPERVTAIRVPVAFGRLREIDARSLYVTSWTSEGIQMLSAFDISQLGCAAGAPTGDR